MLAKNIPEDINAELLLSYYPKGKCKVEFKGFHKRNTYKDIMEAKEERNGDIQLRLGRNSLYNALPEYLFHPVDRFGSLANKEGKDHFDEEYQKQEEEREKAYKFFAPIDLLLLKHRMMIREHFNQYAESNKILIDILGDRLTEEQKSNRFIKQILPFFPAFKSIRGDKTFLTLMLRKIFMEEGLRIERHRKVVTYTDPEPRYVDGPGCNVEETYVGNVFDEPTTVYDIYYWSDDDCDENFLQFVHEIEELESFLQDYLMSLEEIIHFDIWKNEVSLRLSDQVVYNYLNYNTNL